MKESSLQTWKQKVVKKKIDHRADHTAHTLFFILTILMPIVLVFSFMLFAKEAVQLFRFTSPIDFFIGTEWEPFSRTPHYGILPLLNGSLLVALGAVLLATPIALGAALFLTYFSPRRLTNILKPIFEMLVGVPGVVYGYFAINIITPQLKLISPQIDIFNALSASIVVGMSILPFIITFSINSFQKVPDSLLQAGYATGLEKADVIRYLVLPLTLSRTAGSVVIAFARAFGECIAVTIAAGATPKIGFNYMKSIQTVSSYMLQVGTGEVVAGGALYYTLFATGFTLFIIVLFFQSLARRVIRRKPILFFNKGESREL